MEFNCIICYVSAHLHRSAHTIHFVGVRGERAGGWRARFLMLVFDNGFPRKVKFISHLYMYENASYSVLKVPY